MPWYIYAVLFASISMAVGVIWDISWHLSIGRDSFFVAPHLAIYAGGVVAGLACGSLALRTSFARVPSSERARSVRFWRYFHAPLGAWVCVWGAFAMLTAGPLDDWWHNAYGLDVKVLSPPHVLLALGMGAIQIGALLLVLGWQNRAADAGGRVGHWLYALAAGALLMMVVSASAECGLPNQWHRAGTFKALAGVLPMFIVAVGRAGRLKWPATAMTAIYVLGTMIIGWTLQAFPAEPRLAPIYRSVEHMVAPSVPLMLIPAGLAVDLVMRSLRDRSDWIAVLTVASVFVTVLVVTLWFWGDFMLSPLARSYFFFSDQWAYHTRPGPWQYQFWGAAQDPVLRPTSLAWILGLGIVSTRVGLWWGNGMASVRR